MTILADPDSDAHEIDSVVADILGTTSKVSDTPVVEAKPADPGTTPELSEAAKAAAEFDAEHADGKEETAEDKKARAPELQKLIESKGGDEAKFAEGIVEQWNSTAKLAEKVKELEQRLAQTTQPKAEPEPEPELTVDLSEVNTALNALDAERNANQANINVLVAEGTAIKADIFRLEGELRRADEHDKVGIKADIAEKKAELRDKGVEFKELNNRNREIGREAKDLDNQRKQAERDALAARENQQTQQREIEGYRTEQRRIFSDTADGVAKELNVPDAKRDYFKKVVAAQVAFTLRQNESGAPVDMAALTKQLFTEHCKELGFVKDQAFVTKSTEQLQVVGKPPVKPVASTATAKPGDGKAWTGEFARMRAAKILGG